MSLIIPEYVEYPKIGRRYQHYKGGIYEVITLCRHSETDEVLVIYKSELFGSIHARPLSMWFEVVGTTGIKPNTINLLRFTLLNLDNG